MTAASPAVIKTVLPADHEPSLRRWIFAAVAIVLVHAAIVFWILYIRELRSAGESPAAVMIELAPVDVAPTETPPETMPGPKMRQAEPEVTKQPRTVPVPELPPVPNPNVVLTTSHKPKPKLKKIEKEEPKPVVKRTHEPPAPRTSAPPRTAAASQAASSSRASSAAEAAAWRSSWAAALSWSKHYPEAARARGEQGTVRLALTIGRSGHVMSARIIGSSGSATLDQAALEMVRNASGRPLPPEMGASVGLVVPVRYSIR